MAKDSLSKYIKKPQAKAKEIKKKTGSWLFNAAKSLGFSTLEVLSDIFPSTIDAAKTTAQAGRDIVQSIKSGRSADRLVNSAIGKFFYKNLELAKEGLKYSLEDLRSGKLYNQDRVDTYNKKASEEMFDMGEGFDFDTGDDFDTSDTDDFSSSVESDDGNAVASFSRKKGGNNELTQVSVDTDLGPDSTLAMGQAYQTETMVNVSRAMIDYANTNARMIVDILGGMRNEINASLGAISENLTTVVTGFEGVSKTDALAAKYYEDSMGILNKILETMQGQGKPGPTTTKKFKEYEDVSDMFSSTGLLDFDSYMSHVGKQFSRYSDENMILSSIKSFFGDEDTLKYIIQNPLSFIPRGIVSGLIQKSTRMALKSMDDAIKETSMAFLSQVGNLSRSENPLLSALGKIFGVNNKLTVRDLDKSAFNKGQTVWMGTDHQALTNVIPTFLRKILAVLSGNEEMDYDYQNNIFRKVRDMENEAKEEEKRALISGISSPISEMKEAADKVLIGSKGEKDNIKRGLEDAFARMVKIGSVNPQLLTKILKDGTTVETNELKDVLGITDDRIAGLIRGWVDGKVKSGRSSEVMALFGGSDFQSARASFVKSRQKMYEEQPELLLQSRFWGDTGVIGKHKTGKFGLGGGAAVAHGLGTDNHLEYYSGSNEIKSATGGMGVFAVDKYKKSTLDYLREILKTLTTGIYVVPLHSSEGQGVRVSSEKIKGIGSLIEARLAEQQKKEQEEAKAEPEIKIDPNTGHEIVVRRTNENGETSVETKSFDLKDLALQAIENADSTVEQKDKDVFKSKLEEFFKVLNNENTDLTQLTETGIRNLFKNDKGKNLIDFDVLSVLRGLSKSAQKFSSETSNSTGSGLWNIQRILDVYNEEQKKHDAIIARNAEQESKRDDEKAREEALADSIRKKIERQISKETLEKLEKAGGIKLDADQSMVIAGTSAHVVGESSNANEVGEQSVLGKILSWIPEDSGLGKLVGRAKETGSKVSSRVADFAKGVDKFLFEFIYGSQDGRRGFSMLFKKAFDYLKVGFTKFGRFLDEKLLKPLDEALFGENGLFTKFKETEFWKDTKEFFSRLTTNVSTFLFGEKDSEGNRSGGLFSETWNSLKSIGSDVKVAILGEKGPDGKPLPLDQDTSILGNLKRLFYNTTDNIKSALGIDTSDKNETFGAKFSRGLDSIYTRIKERSAEFTKDLFGNFKGGKEFADQFREDLKGQKGFVGASAVIGGIGAVTLSSHMGILGSLFLPSGLIGGAILGAGIGIASKSTAIKNFLFGPEENGERQGGLFTKEFQKFFRDNKTGIGWGAGIGLASSFGLIPYLWMPGGPIGGALIGGALSMVSKSGAFSNFLYGEGGTKDNPTGGLMAKFKSLFGKDKNLKGLAINGAIGAGVGLLGSFFLPGGPMLGAILGGAASIGLASERFKTWFFGTKGDDGQRSGGALSRFTGYMKEHVFLPLFKATQVAQVKILGFVRDQMVTPFMWAMRPIIEEAKYIGGKISDMAGAVWTSVKTMFSKRVVKPIGDTIERYFLKPLRSLFGTIFRTLGTVVGAIISSPFKLITALGKATYNRQQERGARAYDKSIGTDTWLGKLGNLIRTSYQERRQQRAARYNARFGKNGAWYDPTKGHYYEAMDYNIAQDRARDQAKIDAINAGTYSSGFFSWFGSLFDGSKKSLGDVAGYKSSKPSSDTSTGKPSINAPGSTSSLKVSGTASTSNKPVSVNSASDSNSGKTSGEVSAPSAKPADTGTPYIPKKDESIGGVAIPKKVKREPSKAPKSSKTKKFKYKPKTDSSKGYDLGILMKKISDNVQKITDSVDGQLDGVGKNLYKTYQILLKSHNMKDEDITGSANKDYQGFWGKLGRSISKPFETIGGLVLAPFKLLGDSISWTGTQLGRLGSIFGNAGKAIWSGAKAIGTGLWKTVEAVGGGLLRALSEIIQTPFKLINMGITAITSILPVIGQTLTTSVKLIGQGLEGVGSLITNSLRGIGRALLNASEGIGTLVSGITSFVGTAIKTISTVSWDLTKGLWKGIKFGAKTIWGAITAPFKLFTGTIGGLIPGLGIKKVYVVGGKLDKVKKVLHNYDVVVAGIGDLSKSKDNTKKETTDKETTTDETNTEKEDNRTLFDLVLGIPEFLKSVKVKDFTESIGKLGPSISGWFKDQQLKPFHVIVDSGTIDTVKLIEDIKLSVPGENGESKETIFDKFFKLFDKGNKTPEGGQGGKLKPVIKPIKKAIGGFGDKLPSIPSYDQISGILSRASKLSSGEPLFGLIGDQLRMIYGKYLPRGIENSNLLNENVSRVASQIHLFPEVKGLTIDLSPKAQSQINEIFAKLHKEPFILGETSEMRAQQQRINEGIEKIAGILAEQLKTTQQISSTVSNINPTVVDVTSEQPSIKPSGSEQNQESKENEGKVSTSITYNDEREVYYDDEYADTGSFGYNIEEINKAYQQKPIVSQQPAKVATVSDKIESVVKKTFPGLSSYVSEGLEKFLADGLSVRVSGYSSEAIKATREAMTEAGKEVSKVDNFIFNKLFSGKLGRLWDTLTGRRKYDTVATRTKAKDEFYEGRDIIPIHFDDYWGSVKKEFGHYGSGIATGLKGIGQSVSNKLGWANSKIGSGATWIAKKIPSVTDFIGSSILNTFFKSPAQKAREEQIRKGSYEAQQAKFKEEDKEKQDAEYKNKVTENLFSIKGATTSYLKIFKSVFSRKGVITSLLLMAVPTLISFIKNLKLDKLFGGILSGITTGFSEIGGFRGMFHNITEKINQLTSVVTGRSYRYALSNGDSGNLVYDEEGNLVTEYGKVNRYDQLFTPEVTRINTDTGEFERQNKYTSMSGATYNTLIRNAYRAKKPLGKVATRVARQGNKYLRYLTGTGPTALARARTGKVGIEGLRTLGSNIAKGTGRLLDTGAHLYERGVTKLASPITNAGRNIVDYGAKLFGVNNRLESGINGIANWWGKTTASTGAQSVTGQALSYAKTRATDLGKAVSGSKTLKVIIEKLKGCQKWLIEWFNGGKWVSRAKGTGVIKSITGFFSNLIRKLTSWTIGTAKLPARIGSLISTFLKKITGKATLSAATFALAEFAYMSYGFVNGMVNPAGLFEVPAEKVDGKMRTISTAIQTLLSTSLGSLVDFANELGYAILGTNFIRDLATWIYKVLASEEEAEAIELAQQEFTTGYETKVQQEYDTYKEQQIKQGVAPEQVMSFEDFKVSELATTRQEYNSEINKSLFSRVYGGVKNLASTAVSAVQKIGETFGFDIGGAFNEVWEDVKAGVTEVATTISDAGKWIWDSIIYVKDEWVGIYNDVVGGVTDVFQSVGKAFTWIGDNVFKPIAGIADSVVAWFNESSEDPNSFINQYPWLKKTLSGLGWAIGKVFGAIKIVVGGIADGFSWLIHHLHQLPSMLIKGLWKTSKFLVSNGIKLLINGTYNLMMAPFRATKSMISALWNGIKYIFNFEDGLVKDIRNLIKNGISNIWESIKSGFWSGLKSIGKTVAGWFGLDGVLGSWFEDKPAIDSNKPWVKTEEQYNRYKGYISSGDTRLARTYEQRLKDDYKAAGGKGSSDETKPAEVITPIKPSTNVEVKPQQPVEIFVRVKTDKDTKVATKKLDIPGDSQSILQNISLSTPIMEDKTSTRVKVVEKKSDEVIKPIEKPKEGTPWISSTDPRFAESKTQEVVIPRHSGLGGKGGVSGKPSIRPIRVAGKGESTQVETLNGIPYYSQNDPKYKNLPYRQTGGFGAVPSETMGEAGCGPTAMAMVASQATGQAYDPVTMASMAEQGGYSTSVGTTPDYFGAAGDALGISHVAVEPTQKSVESSLSGGNTAIAQIQDAAHPEGHYEVLSQGSKPGEINVSDPLSRETSGVYRTNDFLKNTLSVQTFGGFGGIIPERLSINQTRLPEDTRFLGGYGIESEDLVSRDKWVRIVRAVKQAIAIRKPVLNGPVTIIVGGKTVNTTANSIGFIIACLKFFDRCKDDRVINKTVFRHPENDYVTRETGFTILPETTDSDGKKVEWPAKWKQLREGDILVKGDKIEIFAYNKSDSEHYVYECDTEASLKNQSTSQSRFDDYDFVWRCGSAGANAIKNYTIAGSNTENKSDKSKYKFTSLSEFFSKLLGDIKKSIYRALGFDVDDEEEEKTKVKIEPVFDGTEPAPGSTKEIESAGIKLVGSSDKERIWNYLTNDKQLSGLTAAGLMSSWQDLSGNDRTRVEGSELSDKFDKDFRSNIFDSSGDALNKWSEELFKIYAEKNISINKDAYRGIETGKYYPGVGIAQFSGPRGEALYSTARSWQNGEIPTVDELGLQLSQAITGRGEYLNRPELVEKMSHVTSTDKAAEYILDYYDNDDGGFHGKHSDILARRQAYAREIYQRFNNQTSKRITDTTPIPMKVADGTPEGITPEFVKYHEGLIDEDKLATIVAESQSTLPGMLNLTSALVNSAEVDSKKEGTTVSDSQLAETFNSWANRRNTLVYPSLDKYDTIYTENDIESKDATRGLEWTLPSRYVPSATSIKPDATNLKLAKRVVKTVVSDGLRTLPGNISEIYRRPFIVRAFDKSGRELPNRYEGYVRDNTRLQSISDYQVPEERPFDKLPIFYDYLDYGENGTEPKLYSEVLGYNTPVEEKTSHWYTVDYESANTPKPESENDTKVDVSIPKPIYQDRTREDNGLTVIPAYETDSTRLIREKVKNRLLSAYKNGNRSVPNTLLAKSDSYLDNLVESDMKSGWDLLRASSRRSITEPTKVHTLLDDRKKTLLTAQQKTQNAQQETEDFKAKVTEVPENKPWFDLEQYRTYLQYKRTGVHRQDSEELLADWYEDKAKREYEEKTGIKTSGVLPHGSIPDSTFSVWDSGVFALGAFGGKGGNTKVSEKTALQETEDFVARPIRHLDTVLQPKKKVVGGKGFLDVLSTALPIADTLFFKNETYKQARPFVQDVTSGKYSQRGGLTKAITDGLTTFGGDRGKQVVDIVTKAQPLISALTASKEQRTSDVVHTLPQLAKSFGVDDKYTPFINAGVGLFDIFGNKPQSTKVTSASTQPAITSVVKNPRSERMVRINSLIDQLMAPKTGGDIIKPRTTIETPKVVTEQPVTTRQPTVPQVTPTVQPSKTQQVVSTLLSAFSDNKNVAKATPFINATMSGQYSQRGGLTKAITDGLTTFGGDKGKQVVDIVTKAQPFIEGITSGKYRKERGAFAKVIPQIVSTFGGERGKQIVDIATPIVESLSSGRYKNERGALTTDLLKVASQYGTPEIKAVADVLPNVTQSVKQKDYLGATVQALPVIMSLFGGRGAQPTYTPGNLGTLLTAQQAVQPTTLPNSQITAAIQPVVAEPAKPQVGPTIESAIKIEAKEATKPSTTSTKQEAPKPEGDKAITFNPQQMASAISGFVPVTLGKKRILAPAGYNFNSYTRPHDDKLEGWMGKALLQGGAKRISSRFGSRNAGVAGASRVHGGIDFASPVGTNIKNFVSGRVAISKAQTGTGGKMVGYGNYVAVDSDDGNRYTYGHMSKRGVSVGQRVETGSILGQVGNTGTSGGPHLHMDVRRGNTYLPTEQIGLIVKGMRPDAGIGDSNQFTGQTGDGSTTIGESTQPSTTGGSLAEIMAGFVKAVTDPIKQELGLIPKAETTTVPATSTGGETTQPTTGDISNATQTPSGASDIPPEPLKVGDKPIKAPTKMMQDLLNRRGAFIAQTSEKYKYPLNVLLGQIQQESGGNPNAKSGVGAAGLMQIMPNTAPGLGITAAERYDEVKSIDAGAKYMRQLLDRFKKEPPNQQMTDALMSYNWGMGNVDNYIKRGRTLIKVRNKKGKLVDSPPAEAREYAPRIYAHAKKYQVAGKGISERPSIQLPSAVKPIKPVTQQPSISFAQHKDYVNPTTESLQERLPGGKGGFSNTFAPSPINMAREDVLPATIQAMIGVGPSNTPVDLSQIVKLLQMGIDVSQIIAENTGATNSGLSALSQKNFGSNPSITQNNTTNNFTDNSSRTINSSPQEQQLEQQRKMADRSDYSMAKRVASGRLF